MGTCMIPPLPSCFGAGGGVLEAQADLPLSCCSAALLLHGYHSRYVVLQVNLLPSRSTLPTSFVLLAPFWWQLC